MHKNILNGTHLKNDMLFLHRKGYEMSILCEAKDQFYNQQGTAKVLFHRIGDGKVTAVEIIGLPPGFSPTNMGVKAICHLFRKEKSNDEARAVEGEQ